MMRLYMITRRNDTIVNTVSREGETFTKRRCVLAQLAKKKGMRHYMNQCDISDKETKNKLLGNYRKAKKTR